MKKKTTSQIICENFKISPQTIFQDYKCTLKSSVTFFGRLYIGQEHFLFISNMFGIVKKCVIMIQKVKKVQLLGSGAISVVQDKQQEQQYIFGGFKNNNAFKLMYALWKRQKIAGQILKPQQQENMPQYAQSSSDGSKTNEQISQGKVQANFFNQKQVESVLQKIVQIQLPCSVDQYYQFFMKDNAQIYSRKKHLELKGSEKIILTDWKKNQELKSQVRQLSAQIKVFGVPFMSMAGMNQVCMLQRKQQQGQLSIKIVTQLSDIPYNAYFNCQEHIIVKPFDIVNIQASRGSMQSKKCLMIVNAGVIFNKSTYMKGTILKRTINDMKEDYEFWIKNVKERLQKMKKKGQNNAQSENKNQIQFEHTVPISTIQDLKLDSKKNDKQSENQFKSLNKKVNMLTQLVLALIGLNIIQLSLMMYYK